MARNGDELFNPATGLRTVFRQTAEATNGELLQVDWIAEGPWTTGPDHIHPLQDERFEVVSGRLGLRVNGVERVLEAGDVLEAPAGAPHAAWNAGSAEVHALVDFRPALRTETAFEALAGLAQDGKTTSAGAPKNPLQLALVLRHFEDEIYLARPPLAVQRVLMSPLAALARLLGYRPEYPYPTPKESPMTDNGHHDKPILVLGGTGKTGSRVAARLEARGIPVRIGSRSADPPFDWEDRSTWGPVLDGVRSVYISYYPDIAVPGAPDAVGALAEEAMRHGVRRQVLLAGRGEPEAEEAEERVKRAGGDVTIVRATWFSQNWSEGYWVEYVRGGVVALPAGDTPEPFIDVEDIADVATAALTDDSHIGKLYELTGPRLLTFAEAAGEIGRATGRDVHYQPVSVEDHAAEAAAQGVPQVEIDLLTYLFSEVLDGRNARLADGVQQALGREPRDFAEYARETAAAGVWNAPVSAA